MNSGFEFDLGFNDDRSPWEIDGGRGLTLEPMSADPNQLLFTPELQYNSGALQFFDQGNISTDLSAEHNNSDDSLSVDNCSGSMTTQSHEDHDESNSSDVKKQKRERNKASASKYRLKKKEYLNGLETEVEKLHMELTEKNGRVSALEAENRLLKEQLSFMQKMFAMASNNPGAVSGFAMAFVLLFAFIIPFNFTTSSALYPVASTIAPPQAISNLHPHSTQHVRKILWVGNEDVSVPEGMVQLVMIGGSTEVASNITWFAELPKNTDGFHFQDQVCKVLNLQSVPSPQI